MKRTIATLAAAAALLAPNAARAGLTSDGTLGSSGTTAGCLLPTVDRATATTRLCLSCHDGSLGTSHLPGPAVGSAAGPGMHPVDVGYEAALQRGRRLRPRFEVSRRLAMPDGRLTCVTCHDGASQEPAHLAVPMSRSTLCFACHPI
jgi:predicted CXXCH cytochrome family protein